MRFIRISNMKYKLKMKKLIIFLMMILPLGAFAQDVKIAFVKTQEVIMAMPEVSAMEKTMTELNEKYKTELKQMQEEYQKKYSDFVAQQDSLTENIKLRRMQEIQDIQERINNFLQVAEQDVQKKQQELNKEYQKNNPLKISFIPQVDRSSVTILQNGKLAANNYKTNLFINGRAVDSAELQKIDPARISTMNVITDNNLNTVKIYTK